MIQRVDNIFSEDDGNSWLCLTLKGCQGNRCRDVVRYHNNSQDWAAIVMSQKKHFTIRSKVDLSILTFTEKIVRIQFLYCSCQNVKNSLSHYFSHFCWIQATVAGRYGHMSKYKPVWLILARLALKALAYRRAWMFTYWFKFSNTNPLQT